MIIAAFIAISTTIITLTYVFKKTGTDPESATAIGVNFFRYYTSDSNILVAIISTIIFVYCLQNIIKKKDEMPLWLIVLFLVGVTGTTVTFLTTTFFLSPISAAMGNGYFTLFAGYLFFLHFLNPVLALVLILVLLNYHRLNWKHALMCAITVVIYSFIYTPCVLTNTWPDFYGFTFGGKLWLAPLSLLAMYGVGIGLGFILVLLHNLTIKRSLATESCANSN